MALLDVENLVVEVHGKPAVNGVSFEITEGSRTGLIGESGSGKSLTALALMSLLPYGLKASGHVRLRDRDLLSLSERELCGVRGREIAMVFQEPISALNPMMRVGHQVAESLALRRRMSSRVAWSRAVELIERVQLPSPATTARKYPHQLSGGQCQRIAMAIALAGSPAVLVADEPTTALDVSVQAELLRLMDQLVREEGMALLLITHDLPVVASICDNLLVMYGGRVVESGPLRTVFDAPKHHYTGALCDAATLENVQGTGRLRTIPGSVPPLGRFPAGCVYRNRCAAADEICSHMPELTGGAHRAACHHPLVDMRTRTKP